MIEKIGTIKNPLTIIAIFAGIAEVSGTIVLPFVATANQLIFIYFLILFPTLLVIIFFITLNFNNKALYAPSDYKDEENYLKVFKFDPSTQEERVEKIPLNKQAELLYDQFTKFSESINTKIGTIENILLKTSITDSSIVSSLSNDKSLYEYLIPKLPNVNDFSNIMKKKGYSFQVNKFERPIETNKAIWLGKNIPIDIAKDVILEAKKFYPHLEYIKISREINSAPVESNDQLYIGGSTLAAKSFKLKAIPTEEFKKIESMKSLNELHSFIQSFYPKD